MAKKIFILIVEDDEKLADMYQQRFGFEGFDVAIAHDGDEGLTKLKEVKPDIVLMDIMMPKMNGIEALEKAKQDPEIKDIPILMLTNLTGTADLQTALDKGAVGYIVKSENTPGELVDKILAALARNSKKGSKEKTL